MEQTEGRFGELRKEATKMLLSCNFPNYESASKRIIDEGGEVKLTDKHALIYDPEMMGYYLISLENRDQRLCICPIRGCDGIVGGGILCYKHYNCGAIFFGAKNLKLEDKIVKKVQIQPRLPNFGLDTAESHIEWILEVASRTYGKGEPTNVKEEVAEILKQGELTVEEFLLAAHSTGITITSGFNGQEVKVCSADSCFRAGGIPVESGHWYCAKHFTEKIESKPRQKARLRRDVRTMVRDSNFISRGLRTIAHEIAPPEMETDEKLWKNLIKTLRLSGRSLTTKIDGDDVEFSVRENNLKCKSSAMRERRICRSSFCGTIAGRGRIGGGNYCAKHKKDIRHVIDSDAIFEMKLDQLRNLRFTAN